MSHWPNGGQIHRYFEIDFISGVYEERCKREVAMMKVYGSSAMGLNATSSLGWTVQVWIRFL